MSLTITAKNPFYEFQTNDPPSPTFPAGHKGIERERNKEKVKRERETAMCSFHNEQNIKK